MLAGSSASLCLMLILPHIVEKAQQLARSKGKSFQPETAWSSFSCRISLHDDGVWPSESRSLGTTILTLVQLKLVLPLFNQTMTNNLMLRQKQNDWIWITLWMLKYRCKVIRKTTIHFYPSLDFSGLRGKKKKKEVNVFAGGSLGVLILICQ